MPVRMRLVDRKSRKAANSGEIREQFSELQTSWRARQNSNFQYLFTKRNACASCPSWASVQISREDRSCLCHRHLEQARIGRSSSTLTYASLPVPIRPTSSKPVSEDLFWGVCVKQPAATRFATQQLAQLEIVCPQWPDYSARRACTGFTDAARCAGT